MKTAQGMAREARRKVRKSIKKSGSLALDMMPNFVRHSTKGRGV